MSENQENETMTDASEGGDALWDALGMDNHPSYQQSDPARDALLSKESGSPATSADALLAGVEPTVDQPTVATDTAGPETGTSITAFGTSDTKPSTAEPEPDPEFFRCAQGHVIRDLHVFVAYASENEHVVIADSGPVCRICYVKWMGAKFRTKRCKPPKEFKHLPAIEAPKDEDLEEIARSGIIMGAGVASEV